MADYNGWTNKETWLVNLWLGDMLAQDQEDGIEIDAGYVTDLVYNSVEELPEMGLIRDLLECALGEINYHEIAKHYENEGESV